MYRPLATVEVLNLVNGQWSTAVNLPESLHCCSATVHGDQLYVLGATGNNSVYKCSVSALLQTCSHSGDRGVWSKLPDLPVKGSTCVTFCGQLLAVGGESSDKKPTKAVYMYNQATNSWNVISHMIAARSRPFAAVLPNNQLMVVGGTTNKQTDLDSVEFASLI